MKAMSASALRVNVALVAGVSACFTAIGDSNFWPKYTSIRLVVAAGRLAR